MARHIDTSRGPRSTQHMLDMYSTCLNNNIQFEKIEENTTATKRKRESGGIFSLSSMTYKRYGDVIHKPMTATTILNFRK